MRPADSAQPGRVGSVRMLERALDLLEALAAAPAGRGITELADETGMPRGTAHRLLQTLLARDYVRRGDADRYVLGTFLIRLGNSVFNALPARATPFLNQLSQLTGASATLAVLDGDVVLYIGQALPRQGLRIVVEIGKRARLHSTAPGKMLLAALPDRQVIELIGRTGLPRRTTATITDREIFCAQLRRIRERGWALDSGEDQDEVRSVAVPVPIAEVATVLAIAGPIAQLPLQSLPGLAALMADIAREFGATLGEQYPRAD